MGNKISSITKINFEDMQHAIRNTNWIIINTLELSDQDCIIPNTISVNDEVAILNKLMDTGKFNTQIVIYGLNACDDNIVRKYNQLVRLGFTNVAIYPGGMFEWLLLQEVYGDDEFSTTKRELDILRFKGISKLSQRSIEYKM